jgi:hypothetical protein
VLSGTPSEILDNLNREAFVGSSDASILIDALLQAPRRRPDDAPEARDDRPWTAVDGNHDPAPTAPQDGFDADELEKGVYEVDEVIYIVQRSRSSGHNYAKKLVVISGERLNEADEHVQIEFEYAPGAVKSIRPAHKMTRDRAVHLSLRYGVCIRCGKLLKAAKSVERSIGPVCITYFA